MLAHRKLVAVASVMACISLVACTWPFGTGGPNDIQVVSVSEVNFKDQAQLAYASQKPRPSMIISRIDFSTKTDLLALAKKYEYNVGFAIGPCSKDGVVDNGKGYGYVYWGKAVIYSDTRDQDVPGYAEAVAKKQPLTYQVYAEKFPSNTRGPLCLTLRGGNMVGRKLRSNDAVIPTQP